MTFSRTLPRIVVRLAAIAAAGALPCLGQSLEPRAYSPSPVGMNFVVADFSNSRGDLVFDPSIPLTNVSAEIDTLVGGYLRTFNLFGRFASAGVAVPYVRGTVTGDVFEATSSVDRSGFGDAQARLVVNIVGGPALDPRTFAATPPRTTLGASLIVLAPTGEFFKGKLINISTHRWAVKPELGIVHPVGRWSFELSAATWFFGDNEDFFGGQTREQDPLVALQGHVSYSFKPRLWLAASGTYYGGGQSTVGNVEQDDRQSNTRAGLTFSVPLSRKQSVKVAWTSGVNARVSSKFDTLSAGWVYGFLSPTKSQTKSPGQ